MQCDQKSALSRTCIPLPDCFHVQVSVLKLKTRKKGLHREHSRLGALRDIKAVFLLESLLLYILLSSFWSLKTPRKAPMSGSGSPPTNRTGFIYMFRINFSQSFEKKPPETLMCGRVKAKNDRCNVRATRNRQSTPLWFSFRQRRDLESSLTRYSWKGLRVYGCTPQMVIKAVLSTEHLSFLSNSFTSTF